MTKEKFRTNLYVECPEMRILHDLVNTTKHKELTGPKAKIRETKVHKGGFSSGFSLDGVDKKWMKGQNGQWIEEDIKPVKKWWEFWK